MRLIACLTACAVLSLLALPFPSPALAVEADVKKELQKQKEIIENLGKRVEELEDVNKAETASQSEGGGMFPRFGHNLGAFGDINYLTDSREKRNKSFSVGSLGLYVTGDNNDRLNFLIEMVVVSHNDRSSIDLERVWVGYAFDDLLTVRAGRFHTALGYWNREYHHGRHLFLSVDRPFFLKFEDTGGVIPVHIVGLELAGMKEFGGGRLKYVFEAGNGPGLMTDPHGSVPHNQGLTPRTLTDNNDEKQFVLRLVLDSVSVKGLSIGVSGTRYKAENYLKTISVTETVYGLDAHYVKGGLDLLGEYFRFENSREDADAYYAQAAYSIGRFTPYLRYERLSSNSVDPYLGRLTGGAARHQNIAGVRYEIDPAYSSLKAQFRRDIKKDGDDFDVFEFQWTFHF
ncbi:MAG: hypothetical protein WA162_05810 [Thermodesulfobacteriota bacterium]